MPQSGPDPQESSRSGSIARVLVDVGLPHLDRPFDYRITPEQSEKAVPGARVRVRFAGRLTNGYILERVEASRHPGELAALERVVSAEPVMAPEVAELARRVADHYAGSRADVLRMAIPPRHARTEQAAPRLVDSRELVQPVPGAWQHYPDAIGLLESLAAGGTPRAVVSLMPGAPWPSMLAGLAQATLATGRGTVIVVPDVRDVERVDQALSQTLGSGRHVVLHAEQGPSVRYRRFLAVRRGQVSVVVGTRSAVFAPVLDLGLVVVWDDGDDLLAEPRAPYPHARDVALIRAHQQGCAVVLAAYARTAEAARLVTSGWAHDVRARRATLRSMMPRVDAVPASSGATPARMPPAVFATVRDGLHKGPVLVVVPRRGYRPALACRRCRVPARCARCSGPLAQPHADLTPACRWCAAAAPWVCPECGDTGLRAMAVGDERTAEELGRAFPGTPVRQSGLGHVITEVPGTPALVVATPGAEPQPAQGYSAAVILDAHVALARPDLRAAEESLRRWMNAAALVRPATDGGTVVLVGDPTHRAVQALVRWDPGGFAERELADREATHLPPAWRMAELTGPATAVDELVALSDLPPSSEVLGPLPIDDGDTVRMLVRTPLSHANALARALRAAAGVRSARRRAGAVRIRVDPLDLG